MEKENNILEGLKKYFEETPREQVLKDWEEAGKMSEGVNSPSVTEYMEFVKSMNKIDEKTCPPRSGSCPMMYMYIKPGQTVICSSCGRNCQSSSPSYL